MVVLATLSNAYTYFSFYDYFDRSFREKTILNDEYRPLPYPINSFAGDFLVCHVRLFASNEVKICFDLISSTHEIKAPVVILENV